MKTKYKVRLWPLVKSYGVFVGGTAWLTCKLTGHNWTSIGKAYHEETRLMNDGEMVTQAKIKMRCECCESIRLMRLTLVTHPNGTQEAYSPDGNVKLID